MPGGGGGDWIVKGQERECLPLCPAPKNPVSNGFSMNGRLE